MQPLATLSLDLDDRWTYLKTRGDQSWQTLPTYLPLVVPRILEFLQTERRTITWFLVGKDAALPRNHDLLRAVAQAGHEIASHGFHHEPWLHLYSPQEMEVEIGEAEEAITAATGVRPRGFRGPGFTQSPTGLSILLRRGYLYDASPCANSLGPLARLWYFHGVSLTEEQKLERSRLAGNFRDAFGPNRPFWEEVGQQSILRVPTTTFPVLHTPFHFSYLNLLPEPLALLYLKSALSACRLFGYAPSLVLHPTDFLGAGDDHGIPFFPGLQRPVAAKLDFLRRLLALLPQTVTLGQFAAQVAK